LAGRKRCLLFLVSFVFLCNAVCLYFAVANSSQSDHGTTSAIANEDLSDLSDEDENLYPDREEVEEMKFIRLRLNPTSNPEIRQLFSNTDKVITSVAFFNNHSSCSFVEIGDAS